MRDDAELRRAPGRAVPANHSPRGTNHSPRETQRSAAQRSTAAPATRQASGMPTSAHGAQRKARLLLRWCGPGMQMGDGCAALLASARKVSARPADA